MTMWKLLFIKAAAVTLAALAGAASAHAQGLPGGFVFLRDIDPSILQDIRYAGPNNFLGRRLAGYDAAECVVKREVGMALERIQQELAPQKLSLKMLDCYRPESAVHDMVAWARNAGRRRPSGATIPASAKLTCSGWATSPSIPAIPLVLRSTSRWSI
jgi:D-alanyl-D-alanine dipeptidase